MSEAFTDTTEKRAAEAVAAGAGAGRHRGPVARNDDAVLEPEAGHGRHRRAGSALSGPQAPGWSFPGMSGGM
ncbi:hypothetical protein [Streptomyces sp. NPDC001380]|uniref:hypothetical protein n=1 Tax=Streptomyces sp. NPDC001380 TaxID=3364566 RepID=UPI0036938BDC